MESSRLKNIIILILVLMDLFLLGSLASRRTAELSARRPAPARNGPTARFEKVRKGAGRATSRKRRHGPPTSGEGVKRTVE